jgi:hypothetical protein
MTGMQPSTAREIARQLLAREAAGADEPAAIAAAMQRVCTRTSENLRRSVGDDGYNALLARALARAQTEHPVVTAIRRVGDADISLDGVITSVDAHGLPAVTAAVESLLAAVVDVLSGLIGADMVMNLLDHDSPPRHAPSERHAQ